MNKEDAQIFFRKRGILKEKLVIDGREFPITIKILTNFETDKLEEEFAEVNELDNSISVDGSRLVEERLIRSIINAPFDCPVGDDEFVTWKEATEDQKRIALRTLDPEIRDVILKRISLANSLSNEKARFL